MRSELSSVFLHSPVGRAHLEASRALSAALGPGWRRDELDYLAFLSPLERRLWPGLYHLVLRHAPSVWRGWRRLTDRPGEPRFMRDRVSAAGAAAFAEVLAALRPRLVVSTIGGAAALAGAARARLGAAFLNALVVTHFRAHRHWARPEADLVFVATDEARADLVRHGIATERIVVAGTPIRPGLRVLDRDAKRALRMRLGLGDDPVIIVSSGGTGAYRAERAIIATLEPLGRPIDVLIFKGSPSGITRHGRVRVHGLGFRHDFIDYLAAADACVGKIGSLTAAEACASGVPIVVWQPIAGPEEANAEYLVARGAALWPRRVSELRAALASVLDGGGDRLARGASALHRPGAAERIAAILERAC
jgi:processive 1,2-diacylglycerol beta-glucosyltransferase